MKLKKLCSCQIFLYKEDFNRFISNLEDVIDHIKTELMPEYDYDEYTRRHEEYERRDQEGGNGYEEEGGTEDTGADIGSEEDMSW